MGWIGLVAPILWQPRSPDHPFLNFYMGQSEGICVLRCIDFLNGLHLHADCTSVNNALMCGEHSSVPQHALAWIDMHSGYFEYLHLFKHLQILRLMCPICL
ncbi:hypothetical protein TNCV_2033241 [Trichonephila clavipes]|nr:hypothetical protein TNCV_2033241 [Trichonephila clavipes]